MGDNAAKSLSKPLLRLRILRALLRPLLLRLLLLVYMCHTANSQQPTARVCESEKERGPQTLKAAKGEERRNVDGRRKKVNKKSFFFFLYLKPTEA